MAKRKKDHSEFLWAIAQAVRENRPLPVHPAKDVQDAIERAGGVAAWVKQSPKWLRRLENYLNQTKPAKVKTRKSKGKIVIHVKKKRGQWPKELRSKVEGYRPSVSRQSGPTEVSLSAGMPGNEETDPGPLKRR